MLFSDKFHLDTPHEIEYILVSDSDDEIISVKRVKRNDFKHTYNEKTDNAEDNDNTEKEGFALIDESGDISLNDDENLRICNIFDTSFLIKPNTTKNSVQDNIVFDYKPLRSPPLNNIPSTSENTLNCDNFIPSASENISSCDNIISTCDNTIPSTYDAENDYNIIISAPKFHPYSPDLTISSFSLKPRQNSMESHQDTVLDGPIIPAKLKKTVKKIKPMNKLGNDADIIKAMPMNKLGHDANIINAIPINKIDNDADIIKTKPISKLDDFIKSNHIDVPSVIESKQFPLKCYSKTNDGHSKNKIETFQNRPNGEANKCATGCTNPTSFITNTTDPTNTTKSSIEMANINTNAFKKHPKPKSLAELCAKAAPRALRYRVGLSKKECVEHLHLYLNKR